MQIIHDSAEQLHHKKTQTLPWLGNQAVMGYIFIIPCVLLFVIFTAIPVIRAFWLSFTDYDILTPAKWVGLQNYRRLLNDEIYVITFRNIVYYMVLYVPSLMIISLSFASAINSSLKGMSAFRIIYYLPTLTSPIAASTVWAWILNPQYGLLNQLLGYIGITGPAWLAMSSTAMLSVVMVTVWQGIGANMIIYLAGLQGIPKSLYESSAIDGANKWQTLRFVTIPGLRPTTFFILIMSMISSFQLFDQAFALTQGGPGYATMTPVYLIYNEGFNQLNMGYASAMAFVLFVFILILTFMNFRLNKRQ